MKRQFPGHISERILEQTRKHYAPNTQSSRLALARRESAGIVVTEDGLKLYDLHCDASFNNFGGDPSWAHEVLEIITDQSSKRLYNTEHHNAPNRYAVELAEFLATHAPVKSPSHVFFSNSGAEANEAAQKACISTRYHSATNKRVHALYFQNGFAGRTLGTIPATSSKPERQRDPFWNQYQKEHTLYVPYPARGTDRRFFKEALDAIDLNVVSHLLIELPCQGEGGIRPIDEVSLRYLYNKAQEAGVIWISDGVQCGMGRVGTLFGADVFPWLQSDILTLAKSLGGGIFPIGATILNRNVLWREGEHSNTFGGGQTIARVAYAAVRKAIGLIESGRVRAIEDLIRSYESRFRKAPGVIDVRGIGAMWGIEFAESTRRDRLIVRGEELAAEEPYGLRLLGAGRSVVRLMPPLTMEECELIYVLDLLLRTMHSLII